MFVITGCVYGLQRSIISETCW